MVVLTTSVSSSVLIKGRVLGSYLIGNKFPLVHFRFKESSCEIRETLDRVWWRDRRKGGGREWGRVVVKGLCKTWRCWGTKRRGCKGVERVVKRWTVVETVGSSGISSIKRNTLEGTRKVSFSQRGRLVYRFFTSRVFLMLYMTFDTT